ncbi:putative LRR receptor-like serine/threonine-protein kinase [Drosera capensis]
MDRGIYGSAKSVVVMLMSVAVSSRGSIAQRIPSDEVAALKTISEKLNNTYWKNVSETSCSDNGITFNTSIAPGIFSNVTCDCSFNSGTVCHVKNILLKGLNLSGVFPAEFGNLTQLTLIDLSRNYINGSIPASLCKIPLVNIALVGNRISGPIPDEFGNISTLQQAY